MPLFIILAVFSYIICPGTSTPGQVTYIQRRQLTEAAKLLVFSKKPIIEIALIAGYESQQAFTSIFKSMYKQTPLEWKMQRLQLWLSHPA